MGFNYHFPSREEGERLEHELARRLSGLDAIYASDSEAEYKAAELERYLKKQPDDADAHVLLAGAYLSIGFYDKATAECMRTLELEKGHVPSSNHGRVNYALACFCLSVCIYFTNTMDPGNDSEYLHIKHNVERLHKAKKLLQKARDLGLPERPNVEEFASKLRAMTAIEEDNLSRGYDPLYHAAVSMVREKEKARQAEEVNRWIRRYEGFPA